jgi:hypothetical protein
MNTQDTDWLQITPIWVDAVKLLENPEDVLSIRDAFCKDVKARDDVKAILEEQRRIKYPDKKHEFYNNFIQTKNGEVLVNPSYKIDGDTLKIEGIKRWLYETYHAYNNLKNWFWDSEKSDNLDILEYKVLSNGWVLFDKEENAFYTFKRPETSQEGAWEIDSLWWCMNMKDWIDDEWNINPDLYVASRIKTKSCIDVDHENLNFLWLQLFRKRWFYCLVYLYFLEKWDKVKLKMENLQKIPLGKIQSFMKEDNPGWAWLTLALSHGFFTDKWYWPDVIKSLLES